MSGLRVLVIGLTALLAACGGGGGGSTASAPVVSLPVAVPGSPTITSASASNGAITLSFTPSATVAVTATSYTATCIGSGQTRTGSDTASPIIVTGLSNGTAYACTVTANGSGGGSQASASLSATPIDAGTCSLRERQQFALNSMREWYLFPETLPAEANPAPYASVDAYLDYLAATARGQRRDRFFTYRTSIAEENAFNASGASAGFGIRLAYDVAGGTVTVTEAFETAPAFAGGIDRGDRIIAIGTTTSNLVTTASLLASGGTAAVTNAIGPSTAGLARVLQLSGPGGNRTLTVTKADYPLSAVSPRYGATTLTDGTRRIGYLNLRTFISAADPQLRTAFGNFRAQGITEFIIDFRYNGGGLVSTADLMGDLLGGNRPTSEIFSQLTFRPEKTSNNTSHRFTPTAQSVSPVKIAFIGTGATASASEFVINGMIPSLGANLALVGANTFGKPVGQVALDRSSCDDRLRVVAFSTRNGANSDAYYDGLASAVRNTCQAADDFAFPLGDAREASVKTALDFLAGRSCTPITAGVQTSQSLRASPVLLTPASPTVAQREVPGLF